MLTQQDKNKLISLSDQAWANAQQFLPNIERLATEIKPNTPDNAIIFICLSLVAGELHHRKADA